MNVVLKVTSYKTYDVYFDDVENIDDAKGLFEPEDLEDAIETGGADTIDDAIEVVECPDCGGKKADVCSCYLSCLLQGVRDYF
jgi:hypothetical protein